MHRVSVPVFSVLVEEYCDAYLPVDQTPHVRLTFHVNGTVAQPGLVHIYVCAFVQCDLLQCGYQSVELCIAHLSAQFRRFYGEVSQPISAKRFLASRFAGVVILILVILIIMFSSYRLFLFDAFLLMDTPLCSPWVLYMNYSFSESASESLSLHIILVLKLCFEDSSMGGFCQDVILGYLHFHVLNVIYYNVNK